MQGVQPANPALAAPIPLMGADGNINPTVAAMVIDATTNSNFNTRFRLFPDRGTLHTLNLSQLTWRVLRVSGDRVEFVSNEIYRHSTFGTANTYNNSTLRTNLLNDWAGIGNIPRMLPHMHSLGTTAGGGVAADMIWIPTWDELNVRDAQHRGYQVNGHIHGAWLRSPGTAGHVNGVSPAGILHPNAPMGAMYGVRPVVAFSLTSIQQALVEVDEGVLGTLLLPNQSLFRADGTINDNVSHIVEEMVNTQDRVDRIRMFPTTGAAGSATHSLSNLTWRILDITDNYVTFWATEAYRNVVFGTSNDWSTSGARTQLISDFAPILAHHGFNNHLYPLNTTSHNGVASDLIWLPAENEVRHVGENQRAFNPAPIIGGQWNVTGDIADAPRADWSNLAWMRSAGDSGWAWYVDAAGELHNNSAGGVSLNHAMRPAVRVARQSIVGDTPSTPTARPDPLTPLQWSGMTASGFAINQVTGFPGNGTPEHPHLISSANHLALMARQINRGENLDHVFRLTADIGLFGPEWIPIGTDEFPFVGTFDGAGFIISGLNVAGNVDTTHLDADSDLYGRNNALFGVIDTDAHIYNFRMTAASVTSTRTGGNTRNALLVARIVEDAENVIIEDIVIERNIQIFSLNNQYTNHISALMVALIEDGAQVTIRRITSSDDDVRIDLRRNGGTGNTHNIVSGGVGLIGDNVTLVMEDMVINGTISAQRVSPTGTAESLNRTYLGGLIGVMGTGGDLTLASTYFNGELNTFGLESQSTSFIRNIGGLIAHTESDTTIISGGFGGFIYTHGDAVGTGAQITQHVGGLIGTIAADLSITGSSNTGGQRLNGIAWASVTINMGGIVGRQTSGSAILTNVTTQDMSHTVAQWGVNNGMTANWGGMIGSFTGENLDILNTNMSDTTMLRRLPTTQTTTTLRMGGMVGHFAAEAMNITDAILVNIAMTGGNMHNVSGQGAIVGNFHSGTVMNLLRINVTGAELSATGAANTTGGQGGLVGRIGVNGSRTITEASFTGTIENTTSTGTVTIGGAVGSADAGTLALSTIDITVDIMTTTQNMFVAGGLIGFVNGGDLLIANVDGTINIMKAASIAGENRVGGLIGYANGLTEVNNVPGIVARDIEMEGEWTLGNGAAQIGGLFGRVTTSDFTVDRGYATFDIVTSSVNLARVGGSIGLMQVNSTGVITEFTYEGEIRNTAAGTFHASGGTAELLNSELTLSANRAIVAIIKPNTVAGFNITGGLVGHAVESELTIISSHVTGETSLGVGGAIMGGMVGEMRNGEVTIKDRVNNAETPLPNTIGKDMTSRGGNQFAGGTIGHLYNSVTSITNLLHSGHIRTSVMSQEHHQDAGGVIGRIVTVTGRTDLNMITTSTRVTTSAGTTPRVGGAIGHVLGVQTEREAVRIDDSMFGGWVDRTGSTAATIGAFIGHQAHTTTNIWHSTAGPRSTTAPVLGLAGTIDQFAAVNLHDSEVIAILFTLTLVRESQEHGVELGEIVHPTRPAIFHVGFGVLAAPSPLPNGVYFVGWATSQEAANEGLATFWLGQVFNLTGDITLFAVYSERDPGQGGGPPGGNLNTVTATFNLTGGSTPSGLTTFTQAVIVGQSVVRPDNPVRSGFAFSHWTQDPTTSVPFFFGLGISENITLHAVWITQPTLTLTLVRGSIIHGIDLTNLPVQVLRGEVLQVGGDERAPILAQYNEFVFLGWSLTRARANSQVVDFARGSSFDVWVDMRLYAVWQNSNANFIPGPGGQGEGDGENPGGGGAVSPLSTVHLFGVGGSVSNFANTRHFNPFIPTDLILPTFEYMNSTFIQNNPRFEGLTFTGWYTTATHTPGTGPHLVIPETAGRTITFHAKWE